MRFSRISTIILYLSIGVLRIPLSKTLLSLVRGVRHAYVSWGKVAEGDRSNRGINLWGEPSVGSVCERDLSREEVTPMPIVGPESRRIRQGTEHRFLNISFSSSCGSIKIFSRNILCAYPDRQVAQEGKPYLHRITSTGWWGDRAGHRTLQESLPLDFIH